MNQWLKPPRAVQEAKEAQKGMHLVLEILVFIAVFLVCTIGEVLVVMPVQISIRGFKPGGRSVSTDCKYRYIDNC